MNHSTPTLSCSVTVIRDQFNADRSRETVDCHAGQWLAEAVRPLALPDEWVAVDSGKVLDRAAWDRHLIVHGSHILIYPRISDSPLQIATGIIFPPLGIYYGLNAMGAPSWVSLLSMGAFGGALGTALAAKMGIDSILTPGAGQPTFPSYSSAGDMEGSATYGFSGIEVA